MEKKHQEKIVGKFLEETTHKKIIVLDIPDIYKYMDQELIEEIKTSIAAYL